MPLRTLNGVLDTRDFHPLIRLHWLHDWTHTVCRRSHRQLHGKQGKLAAFHHSSLFPIALQVISDISFSIMQ